MTATLALLGDVMLGRKVDELLPQQAPRWFWGSTLPVLRSADAVIANLECAITEHTRRWEKTRKVFHFRARPRAVEVLREAGVRCVSLANNHTLDFQEQGLLDTLGHLDSAGIRRAGAGRTLSEARMPAVLEAGGLKVGVIGMTDNEPAFAAAEDRPGTNHVRTEPTPAARAPVEAAVQAARRQGAQLIVLSVHWGPNMVPRPPAGFRSFAREATQRGVDVIHGHSAHVFQGVEVCHRRPVLYDSGDFIDDYAVDPEMRNDWSFVFLVEVQRNSVQGVRMLPVRLRFGRVGLAEGEDFEAICGRMQALCGELGTPAERTREGLRIDVRREPVGPAGD